MKNYIIKISTILGVSALALTSCGPKENPPLVYFPDMYFPVAYDPLMKAEDPYVDHKNEIPAFVKNDGATGLVPVDGTVAQNEDGVVEVNDARPLSPTQYNEGYDASKLVTASPLNASNLDKDVARGKDLYNKTCAVCHGTAGDGQGSIVKSGAYVGVPNFKDREITLGSVHYVLSYGRNSMGSYAGQLKPGDRWRVAMYIMKEFKGQKDFAGSPIAAAKPVADSTQTK